MIRLVVMEGDGIGPEISAATIAVLRAAGRKFGLDLAFTNVTIGLAALRAQGTTFPAEALAAAQSISSPTSARRAPVAAFRRAAGTRSTS